MKKSIVYIACLLLALLNVSGSVPLHWTDFIMTVVITNNSDEAKRLYLEKGRILEISRVNSTHFQSVIITEGEGWIEIPPRQTVQRQIRGVCLHEGLKFPPIGERIVLTPFTGNEQLIAAGSNQEAVHKLTEFPRENVAIVTAKGYSDSHKDGKAIDQEEAFKAAVENAARESGFTFTSETILSNLKLIKTLQKISVEEKSIKLNRVIHEDYDEKTGEYLYIGEFEVRSMPSKPQIIK